MKDYYRILALSSGATEDEIRRAYRRLALQHHPDRNPGDPAAEERFKKISEAYGVLIDPVKRRSYDQWHGANERTTHQGGFGYTQEEIFRDLFNDPRASQVFQELIREFPRAGVRFDRGFLDQLFFGGRGILFGGVFIWGPFGSPRVRIFGPRPREQVQEGQPTRHGEAGFLERLGRKIGGYLLGSSRTLPETVSVSSSDRDLHYHLTIPSDEAREGTHVRIAIDRGGGRENLQVRIPPDTRSGTRLRLRGKGLALGRESGDLFLTIEVAPS